MAKQEKRGGSRRQKGTKKGNVAPKVTADKTPPQTEELLDMNQAIDILKTTRPTFYRWLRAGKIKGMKLGRQWRFRLWNEARRRCPEPAFART